MQKVKLTVYVPKTLRLRVVEMSRLREKTLSDYVRDILEEHYAGVDAEKNARLLEPATPARKGARR